MTFSFYKGIIESPPTDQYAWANEKTELACTLSKDVETTTYDSVTWKVREHVSYHF